MVAHHAQSVGIPPPVALTMMIVGRWTWGRSAYRWTKSAATMALAIRAKSLSASVMRSRRQQPEYAPVKAACSSPVWLNPLLRHQRVCASRCTVLQWVGSRSLPENPVWEAYGKPRRKEKPAEAEECSRMSRQRATTPRQHARLTELLRRCNRPSFHWVYDVGT